MMCEQEPRGQKTTQEPSGLSIDLAVIDVVLSGLVLGMLFYLPFLWATDTILYPHALLKPLHRVSSAMMFAGWLYYSLRQWVPPAQFSLAALILLSGPVIISTIFGAQFPH